MLTIPGKEVVDGWQRTMSKDYFLHVEGCDATWDMHGNVSDIGLTFSDGEYVKYELCEAQNAELRKIAIAALQDSAQHGWIQTAIGNLLAEIAANMLATSGRAVHLSRFEGAAIKQ